jgi:hypothetical protein
MQMGTIVDITHRVDDLLHHPDVQPVTSIRDKFKNMRNIIIDVLM